jgi:hypothetical protein
VSAGLDGWLAQLGATDAFAPAAALLTAPTGLAVSAETLRQHSEARGSALEAAEQAAIAQVHATQDAAEPIARAPGTLVVETDGVMVRYQDGWHEAKLGLVGGWDAGARHAASYVAAREGPNAFGARLLTEAARRGALEIVDWHGPRTGPGLAVLRPVVVLGDGAPWIWHLAAAHFGERTEIVDFYHAAEHVWTIAHTLWGTGSAAATSWARARVHELRAHGGAAVLAALRGCRAPTADGHSLLQRERGYFQRNLARMDYPAFRARGLPIGSGAVESAAKHLVQLRLKRPGARWSEAGARAILTLRARLLSGRLPAA